MGIRLDFGIGNGGLFLEAMISSPRLLEVVDEYSWRVARVSMSAEGRQGRFCRAQQTLDEARIVPHEFSAVESDAEFRWC